MRFILKTATATKLNDHPSSPPHPQRKQNKTKNQVLSDKHNILLLLGFYREVTAYLCERQWSCWATWPLQTGRRGIPGISRSPCHICPTGNCKSLCIPFPKCHRDSLRAERGLKRLLPLPPLSDSLRIWINLLTLTDKRRSLLKNSRVWKLKS